MNAEHSPLLVDLYQLTMLHAYRASGMGGTAVFELFVRKLPRGRAFLLAAGLESVLSWVAGLRFGAEELAWVRDCGRFPSTFVDWLAGLRFTGDIDALPEGTVFFPNEPILRVVAPIHEAQLIESRLVNLVHLQTLIASKAARAVLVAEGHPLVDFGMRRAHGAEAAMLGARSAYLAGYAGTATVLASARYRIPVFGTMAHSFVQAHDDETRAFAHFARAFPHDAILLVNTWDTEAAVYRVSALAPRLAREGIRIAGIRIDSGDLASTAKRARRILDATGLKDLRILASGNLDERQVRDLLRSGAPIDAFGVGTSLSTSIDAPALDMVYKLQEYDRVPRRKRSPGKATWPGRKRVLRHFDEDGLFDHDVVSIEWDPQPGLPLLVPVMRGGRRINPPEPLAAIRARAADSLGRLPQHLRSLDDPRPPYPVEIAPALQALADELDRQLRLPRTARIL